MTEHGHYLVAAEGGIQFASYQPTSLVSLVSDSEVNSYSETVRKLKFPLWEISVGHSLKSSEDVNQGRHLYVKIQLCLRWPDVGVGEEPQTVKSLLEQFMKSTRVENSHFPEKQPSSATRRETEEKREFDYWKKTCEKTVNLLVLNFIF